MEEKGNPDNRKKQRDDTQQQQRRQQAEEQQTTPGPQQQPERQTTFYPIVVHHLHQGISISALFPHTLKQTNTFLHPKQLTMAATIKRDENKSRWEDSEFPMVCETCLGDNAYIRMTKESHGKKCNICESPFTVFAWQAGTKGRLKRVEICKNCAQTKNVCQVCIYDMQYGLPVAVRDKVLKEAGGGSGSAVPLSHANRSWFAQQQARSIEQGETNGTTPNALAHAKLKSMARMEPRYERNLAKLCSFFARGECNRGKDCPFRHELPKDRNDPLAKQNTRDRFHGTHDPVAEKMLAKLQDRQNKRRENGQQPDGQERAKATLYLRFQGDNNNSGSSTRPTLTETAIRDQFYSFGEIVSVRMQAAKGQAFVEYTQPEACQMAITTMNRKTLLGHPIFVSWARVPKRGNSAPIKRGERRPVHAGRAQKEGQGKQGSVSTAGPAARPLPKGLTAAPGGGVLRRAGAAAAKAAVGSTAPYYPSADPGRLGTKAGGK